MSLTLEEFLDYTRSAAHWGQVAAADGQAVICHPVCGDRVELSWRLRQGVFEEIRFQHRGCLLSRAGAALLCDSLCHQSLAQLSQKSAAELLDFDLTQLTLRRQGCVRLAYDLFQQLSLQGFQQAVIPASESLARELSSEII